MIAADHPRPRRRQASRRRRRRRASPPRARRPCVAVRAGRPRRRQRRRDASREPWRNAMPRPARRSRSASPAGNSSATRRVSSRSSSAPAIIACATEDRPRLPALSPGDRLALGPLRRDRRAHARPSAPRSRSRFAGTADSIWAGIARSRRPIQYAHVPEPLALWDVWTRIAARPVAFEPPSAGFALDWRTLAAWRSRGIGFATLTHAAGISSTGDAALDERLPFDEPYRHPRDDRDRDRPHALARRPNRRDRHDCRPRARSGGASATEKSTPATASPPAASDRTREIRIVDAILSGVHQPGESHYELLRAFADDADARPRMAQQLEAHRYRSHEFGDSVLIERRPGSRTAICHPRAAEANPRPRAITLTTPMIGPYPPWPGASSRPSSGA